MNINRPQERLDVTDWPKCSFFAIYDGHGGSTCADFLKDNLQNKCSLLSENLISPTAVTLSLSQVHSKSKLLSKSLNFENIYISSLS